MSTQCLSTRRGFAADVASAFRQTSGPAKPAYSGCETGCRRSILALVVAALVVSTFSVHADVPRFTVRLFFDRVRPDDFVRVVDFRVAETAGEPAATHFRLRATEGTFHVPFELVGQIEFLRFLEAVDEVVRYEARVSFRNGRSPRVGVLELRVLEGTADGMAWHHLLVTQPDRGARLFKIVFQDTP